jgi:hypothetical protein
MGQDLGQNHVADEGALHLSHAKWKNLTKLWVGIYYPIQPKISFLNEEYITF